MVMTYRAAETDYVLSCGVGLLFETRDQFVQLPQRTVTPLTAADANTVTVWSQSHELNVLLALLLDSSLCHVYEVNAVDILPVFW